MKKIDYLIKKFKNATDKQQDIALNVYLATLSGVFFGIAIVIENYVIPLYILLTIVLFSVKAFTKIIE